MTLHKAIKNDRMKLLTQTHVSIKMPPPKTRKLHLA